MQRGRVYVGLKALTVLLAILLAGCSTTRTEQLNLPPPATVAQVDLHRYAGKWFEIARLPNRFQTGCTNTTATYSLLENGEIRVRNECERESIFSERSVVHGYARVVDKASRSKLEVSFFRPFYGDYWIVDLASDYSWAVVASPGRDSLWILSRKPSMETSQYSDLVRKLGRRGFDVEKLLVTDHGEG